MVPDFFIVRFVGYNNRKFLFITTASQILATPIEYLKGVGPFRADLLKKELEIFTFGDLLHHFPLRHIDKTKVGLISEINALDRKSVV